MSQYVSRFILLALIIALPRLAAAAEPYFFADGFESGNLSTSSHPNFRWSGPNNTGVMSHAPTPHILWGTGQSSDFSKKDWHARLGNNALRVVYPAGKYWAEQRFDFG